MYQTSTSIATPLLQDFDPIERLINYEFYNPNPWHYIVQKKRFGHSTDTSHKKMNKKLVPRKKSKFLNALEQIGKEKPLTAYEDVKGGVRPIMPSDVPIVERGIHPQKKITTTDTGVKKVRFGSGVGKKKKNNKEFMSSEQSIPKYKSLRRKRKPEVELSAHEKDIIEKMKHLGKDPAKRIRKFKK